MNQVEQNIQNGSSMLKVAEGGIQKIIDVLQDMKSLAVNAANDSNTGAERNALQKELTQRLATINDIANGTKYNGTGLIDGTYDAEGVFSEDVIVMKKFNLQDFEMSSNKDYTKEVYINGKRVVIGENKVSELAHGFKAIDGYGISTITNPSALKSYGLNLDCDMGFGGSGSTWRWGTAYESATGVSLRNKYNSSYETGVEIIFSGTSAGGSIPDTYDDQGFSILCSGCQQYINIVFDKDMNIGQGTVTTYIYDVSVNGTGEVVCVCVDKTHNLRIAKNPNNPSEYLFVKTNSPSMLILDSGTILATGNANSNDNLPQGTVIQNVTTTQPEIQKINVDTNTKAEVWDKEEESLDTIITHGSPLGVHDGTQFKEYDRYTIKSMQTKDLMIANVLDDEGNFLNKRDLRRYEVLSGHSDRQRELLGILKDENSVKGDVISLVSVEGANEAIKIIDRALDYALENATRLGAHRNQLEDDQERIFIMEENTAASQSVIRDVDVSKEMVTYTRAQVLSKASQFMLSQAGQNSFSVLNLVRQE